jgi:two-component system, OmpR family, sensor kinase
LISTEKLQHIFEYGISDGDGQEETERRGQGLFVSKSYIAKMGGTIEARNLVNGVVFIIRLPKAKSP